MTRLYIVFSLIMIFKTGSAFGEIDTNKLIFYSNASIIYDLYQYDEFRLLKNNVKLDFKNNFNFYEDYVDTFSDYIFIINQIDKTLTKQYFINEETKEITDSIIIKPYSLKKRDTLRRFYNEINRVCTYVLAYNKKKDIYYRLKGYKKLDILEFINAVGGIQKFETLDIEPYYLDVQCIIKSIKNTNVRIVYHCIDPNSCTYDFKLGNIPNVEIER